MADSDKFMKLLKFTAAAWKELTGQLEVYKTVKKLDDLTVYEQIAYMLKAMVSESVPVYKQFTFRADGAEPGQKTLTNCITMFDRYFEPVKM